MVFVSFTLSIVFATRIAAGLLDVCLICLFDVDTFYVSLACRITPRLYTHMVKPLFIFLHYIVFRRRPRRFTLIFAPLFIVYFDMLCRLRCMSFTPLTPRAMADIYAVYLLSRYESSLFMAADAASGVYTVAMMRR